MALENPALWASQPGTAADTNDLTEETSETSGRATWDGFFGTINSISTKSGGIAPMREDFNGLFALITEQLWFLQRGGIYRYDSGVTYEQDAVVFHNGVLWISLADNNTGNDPEADDGNNWVQLVTRTELNDRLSTVESRLGLITDESLESLSSLDDLVARVDAIEEAVTDSDTYKSAVEALAAADGVTNLSAYISNHTRGPLDLGSAGDYGFGLGYVEGDTATELEEYLGLVAKERNTDPMDDNYGNYLHATNGSHCGLYPIGYVRYGSEGAEQYDIFGGNSLEIISPEEYDKLSSADAEGFFWPYVGWDGGEMKDFFVRGKYLGYVDLDKNVMISDNFYEPTVPNDIYTANGEYACNLIDYARAIGDGWNINSVWMDTWVSTLLPLAHAQKLVSAKKCAWYDADQIKNYPRKYNLQGNRDDSAWRIYRGAITRLMYLMNSHNGQMCGCMDLGYMWEYVLGIVTYGSSSTSSSSISSPEYYIKSRESSLKDITSDYGTTNGAWGTASNLSSNGIYNSEPVTLDLSVTSTANQVFWGNGTNQVFTDPTDTENGGYELFGVVPRDDNAVVDGASGSNMMGSGFVYTYGRQNMFFMTNSRNTYDTENSENSSDYLGLSPFGRTFNLYRTVTTNAGGAARPGAYPA